MQGQLFFNPAEHHAAFMRDLAAGVCTTCPTCRRHAQIYRRTFHASMARQLIQLYRLGGAVGYVHASALIIPGISGAGDFSKAKYWGLIATKINTDSHTKANGMWTLTPDGMAFVNGHLNIPREVHIFDDQIHGVSAQEISIQDALGKRFNYHELMGG